MKKVKAFPIDMSGFKVKQAIPHPEIEQVSPFILLHYAKNTLIGDEKPEELGVPPHPHTGFSPVSIIYDGAVHHRDSLGNSSIVEKGGIQWINSAKGIIHSERPTKEHAQNGGKQELIQLWVNTPAKHKKDEAEYFPFEKSELPNINISNSEFTLIAGEYNQDRSPVKTHTNLTLMNGYLEKGDTFQLKFDKKFKVSIFVLNGNLLVDDTEVDDEELLTGLETELNVRVIRDSRILVLAGEPIDEPLVTYGPFVVNTQAEIKQAMLDYQSGKFGKIEETFE